jgi:hypothetical protein
MMTLTKLQRVFLVVVGVAAFSVAGCGDDDDGSGTGPEDGVEITAANASVVQAQVMSSLGTVAAKGPGTHNGASSGTVTIALTKPAQFSYRMEFEDYSDDGEIYYDGVIQYTLSGTSFNYTFDVEISGAYTGEVVGEIAVTNGSYSGYWTVNGTRVNF